jgi:hypothetical protein
MLYALTNSIACGGFHAQDRAVFEETLSLTNRELNLMNWADRSPITTVPHAKVARAFDIFRKLGMRHLCVIDVSHRLVGMLTRKDLMTYRVMENIIPPHIEGLIKAWLYRVSLSHLISFWSFFAALLGNRPQVHCPRF